MIPEAITEEPTDLRPLQPTDIGFMARHDDTDDFTAHEPSRQYLLVKTFTPHDGQKEAVKDVLRRAEAEICRTHQLQGKVRSFWVLEYAESYGDPAVVLIGRYSDRMAFQAVENMMLLPFW